MAQKPFPKLGLPAPNEETRRDAATRDQMTGLFESLGDMDLDDPGLVTLDGDDALATSGSPSRTPKPETETVGVDSSEIELDDDPAALELDTAEPSVAPPLATASAPAASAAGSTPQATSTSATSSTSFGPEPAPADVGLELAIERPVPRPAPAPIVAPPQPFPTAVADVGRKGPLLEDPVASRLLGLALGLGLALVPASMAAAGLSRADVEPRMAELADAIERPLAVRAERVRAPRAIAAEIHDAESRVTTRFWGVWMVIGLPLGAALAFVRRG